MDNTSQDNLEIAEKFTEHSIKNTQSQLKSCKLLKECKFSNKMAKYLLNTNIYMFNLSYIIIKCSNSHKAQQNKNDLVDNKGMSLNKIKLLANHDLITIPHPLIHKHTINYIPCKITKKLKILIKKYLKLENIFIQAHSLVPQPQQDITSDITNKSNTITNWHKAEYYMYKNSAHVLDFNYKVNVPITGKGFELIFGLCLHKNNLMNLDQNAEDMCQFTMRHNTVTQVPNPYYHIHLNICWCRRLILCNMITVSPIFVKDRDHYINIKLTHDAKEFVKKVVYPKFPSTKNNRTDIITSVLVNKAKHIGISNIRYSNIDYICGKVGE